MVLSEDAHAFLVEIIFLDGSLRNLFLVKRSSLRSQNLERNYKKTAVQRILNDKNR